MYTTKDLENIESAITKLQEGTRVVSVAYGDHVVRYADANINDLLRLRTLIKKELNLSDGTKERIRHMHFSTHKGV